MLNIPVEIQELIKTDGVKKNFRVHFPNGEMDDINSASIVEESVKFTESICSRDCFKFGLAEQSQIEFETVGIGNMYGYTIECFYEIDATTLASEYQTEKEDVPYPVYAIPYGRFVIVNCPRQHGAMSHRKITAYSVADPIEDWSIAGIHPQSKMTIYPTDILQMIGLNTSDMEEIPQTTTNLSQFEYGDAGWNSGSTDQLTFNGTGRNYYFQKSWSASKLAGGKILLNVDYTEDEYDYDWSTKQFKLAVNKCPGGGYYYDSDKKRIFQSAAQAFACHTGMFKPFYRIDRWFSGTDTIQIGYPHVLKPKTNIIIDWQNEPMPYKRSDYTGDITGVKLTVIIPKDWGYSPGSYSPAFWYTSSKEYAEISGWTYPTHARSGGTLKVYVKTLDPVDADIEIDSDEDETTEMVSVPAVTINATLKTTVPALGSYYTYTNAFSPLKFIEGYLEMTAQFAKQSRYGGMEIVSLDTSNPELITMDKYRDCWWDEYDVSPVGKIRYKIGENSDFTVEYTFGDGKSVYEMKDNYYLQHLEVNSKSVKTVNAVFDRYFIPKLQNLTFTPTDLEAMGLPYIESGDYLRVQVTDDEYIYTFVMRRELEGIYTLVDEISSTAGEIIDVGVRNI